MTDHLIGVGDGATVILSEDNGFSWGIRHSPADQDNSFNCLGVCFINESTGLLYGSKETILKTIDGGINWNIVYSGNTNYFWQCINEIALMNQTTLFAVADYGQILKSADAGDSWELIDIEIDFNLNMIEFSDDTTGLIFGEGEKYLRTIDGGQSWIVENLPPSISGLNFKDVYFTTPFIGYVIGTKYIQNNNHGKIYKTVDKGNTWTEVFSDENGWCWPEAIDFRDENSGIVCCNTIMNNCIIYITSDGGDTWEETAVNWYLQQPCKTVCYYENDKAIISGNMGTMLYSENGGGSWELYSERIITGEILHVQFLNNETAYLSAVGGSGSSATYDIFKTTDNGENWSKITCLKQPGTFHFINSNIGYVAFVENSLTVNKTINGGSDWTVIESGNYDFEPTCVRFYDEQNGLICGVNSVIKTSDGGYNWIEVDINPYAHSFIDIEFNNVNEVLICGDSYDGTIIMKSYDGGNTFEYFSFNSNLCATDIYLKDSNTVFITASDAILTSEDGGYSWTGANIYSQNDIYFNSIHFPSMNVGYAVGYGQHETIVKTIDGGETWNVINSGTTSGLTCVHFLDVNTGYVFGENGVVMKTTNDNITGIEQSASDNFIDVVSVFPNPFTENIKFSIKTKHQERFIVSVYDINGKLISEKQSTNITNEININLSGLKNGIYLCFIKIRNQILSKKIVKIT